MNSSPGTFLTDRRVTLEHLRVFVAIAEGDGFVHAGRSLHRTQSALTQSLRKLEEVLECRLLQRRQGHVTGLTAHGQRFLPQAREILARVSDAVEGLQKPALSGRIRLGVPDDFNPGDIHGALSRCLAMNPDLKLRVTSALSAELRRMLAADELDIAVLKQQSGQWSDGGTQMHRRLGTEPLAWVAGRPAAFDQLPEFPLVSFPEGCAYREIALDCLKATGKAVSVTYSSASYENIRNATAAGLGIAVLPQSALGPDLVALGAEQGFPQLPQGDVVMIVRTQDEQCRRFADFLEYAPSIGNRWT